MIFTACMANLFVAKTHLFAHEVSNFVGSDQILLCCPFSVSAFALSLSYVLYPPPRLVHLFRFHMYVFFFNLFLAVAQFTSAASSAARNVRNDRMQQFLLMCF